MGRTLQQYELACALRRARPSEFADDDPDFVETYQTVDSSMKAMTDSNKLSDRQKAEAARLGQMRAAEARMPSMQADAAVGEDLSSMVDREAASSGGAAASSTAVQPGTSLPASTDYDLDAFEAQHGLGRTTGGS